MIFFHIYNKIIDMKINNKELQQIIQEETMRFKKKMMLEAEKESILKKLQEMEDCDMAMEEGLGDMIGRFMGSKKSPEDAAAMFNQTFMSPKGKPVFQNITTQLGITPEIAKAAIIRFIMENGGMPVLGGAGKNAVWDAATSSFKRQAGQLGGGTATSFGG